MKKLFFSLLLSVSILGAHAANWETNAEEAYRTGQAICYNRNDGGMPGDAAHVAAADASLAPAGVSFLQLCAFRDTFGSSFTSSVDMGTIWTMINLFEFVPW